jgi:hypothetical protein
MKQGGIDWENRDHHQRLQHGPMVGRFWPDLVAIWDASLAAVSGFRLGLAFPLKAATHCFGMVLTGGEAVQWGQEHESNQQADRYVDGSSHPLRS